MAQLAQRRDALRTEQAQVLAVVEGSEQDAEQFGRGLPFPVLADPGCRAHASVGAIAGGKPAPALFVTDRFREVLAAFRTAEGDRLPDADEILDWLGFVNRQCEECYPPEWPA